MAMDPSQRAYIDQAIAQISTQVDSLVAAFAVGSAKVGREQNIADFIALFQRGREPYTPAAVAAIAAVALARLADR